MKRFVMLLILVFFMCSLSSCYEVSNGTRTGVITKFSKKGMFVKTWEGEMVMGGAGASGNAINTWSFTVENANMVNVIKEKQLSQDTVTLSYREEWFVAPWRGDTTYFIYGVVK